MLQYENHITDNLFHGYQLSFGGYYPYNATVPWKPNDIVRARLRVINALSWGMLRVGQY